MPRAMATSWKAVRERFSVGKLGTGCVAMLWEHLLEEKTLLDVDVAALKETMSSTWYPGQELSKGTQVQSSLQSLTFGKAFSHSLDGIQLPSSLHSLTFGFEFDQGLDGIQLPSSLQGLTFGSLFNRSLEGIQLPCSLQSLTFGSLFNQSIEGAQLPSVKKTPAFQPRVTKQSSGSSGQNLSDYNVQTENLLHLMLHLRGGTQMTESARHMVLRACGDLQVFVKTLTGKTCPDDEESLCNQEHDGISMSLGVMGGDELDQAFTLILQRVDVDSPCKQPAVQWQNGTTGGYISSIGFGKLEREAFEPRFMLRDGANKADAPCNQECEGVHHGTGIQADIMRLCRVEGDAVRAGRYCIYRLSQVLWRLRSKLRRDGLN